jgi:hypothetical protein
VANDDTLEAMTKQVFQNHWDLVQNIKSASGGNPHATGRITGQDRRPVVGGRSDSPPPSSKVKGNLESLSILK